MSLATSVLTTNALYNARENGNPYEIGDVENALKFSPDRVFLEILQNKECLRNISQLKQPITIHLEIRRGDSRIHPLSSFTTLQILERISELTNGKLNIISEFVEGTHTIKFGGIDPYVIGPVRLLQKIHEKVKISLQKGMLLNTK